MGETRRCSKGTMLAGLGAAGCGLLAGEGLAIFYLPFLAVYYRSLLPCAVGERGSWPSWAAAGFNVGCFHLGGCLLWLPGALRDYSGLSGPAVALFVVVWAGLQGTHGCLHGWLLGRRRLRDSRGWELVAGLLWLAIRETLRWPLTVEVGDLIGATAGLARTTPYLGTWGLTFCVHVAVAAAVRSFRLRVVRRELVVVPLLLAVVAVLPPVGSVRERPSLYLHLLQPANGLVSTGAESDDLYHSRLQAMVRRSLSKTENAGDLVVLPEGGLRWPIARPWSAFVAGQLRGHVDLDLLRILAERRASAILQHSEWPLGDTAPPFAEAIVPSTPTAFLYESGVFVDSRTKQYLVPFVEAVPGAEWLPVLGRLGWWTTSVRARSDKLHFRVQDLLFVPLICYESLFRRPFFRAASEDADVVLVLSNDDFLGRRGASLHYHCCPTDV